MIADPDDLERLLLQRHRCLSALADDPYTKRDLVNHLGIPRSTLDDIMRELDAADLVTYANGEWHTTLIGQCVVHVHDQYISQLVSLTDVASLVGVLSTESPIGCEFLIGADVHEAETAIPDEVIHVLLESAADATRIRVFTPSVISAYVEPFYGRATAGDDYYVELVVPLDLFERLQSLYPDLMDDTLHDARMSVFHRSILVSFGLWIADDTHAGIIIYTESGIRGILVNDTTEALAWAERQYECVKRDADAIVSHGGTCRTSNYS